MLVRLRLVWDDSDKGRDKEENGDGGEEVARGEPHKAGLEAEVHAGDEQIKGGFQDQVQDLNLDTPFSHVLSVSESCWFLNLVHDAELSTHCMMLKLFRNFNFCMILKPELVGHGA